ncbi:MAG: phosphoribosylformylglycinamidine synthase, partial [Bacteroidota bacterium]
MIVFFQSRNQHIYGVQADAMPHQATVQKLCWLFNDAVHLSEEYIHGTYIGPRKEMITPWSTNAVEITQNMGIPGIVRIEEFIPVEGDSVVYDPMLKNLYQGLDQAIYTIEKEPDKILFIDDIEGYNQQEGLALSDEEINYLNELSERIGRKLTDSEIFGFSQVNSEHCRHKIFNGQFIIDGEEMPESLFQLIKLTTRKNTNKVVSAYKDNCAFIQGPRIDQFAPVTQNKPDFFSVKPINSVISLKAETHNFPTTVEPFNGAATGTGGEIRDRIAGGKAAIPLAGTAVYMTSYSRSDKGRSWEKNLTPRKWLYQSPEEILIKASNGASDFGNKFGQPLICGSVLTFEHTEHDKAFGFDKVIMLAGGVGFGKKEDSLKDTPKTGDNVVLLGGDNYRIGMGGGAVSSVATGEYNNAIELNAVQRSNPEMQKRVCNAIRALGEADHNPIVSIHDHGAGGHLNCLSELVEETGGVINIDKLPIGDPTLSAKEVIGNESQERMGLILKDEDIDLLHEIAERERAPMYVVGKTTGDHQFTFVNNKNGEKPLDLKLSDMFGNPPKTILTDTRQDTKFAPVDYQQEKLEQYVEEVMQLEAVACKDWLTNKVDRSVTGRVATQQTTGEIQLPLNNVAVTALDYQGKKGIATSIGHAPAAGLIDSKSGSILSIAEALTNMIWAPVEDRLRGVSLSANWMWPAKNPGENSRLFDAVKAASDYATSLGINIPTGKDSLSMTQKYPDGKVVYSPGTVIISTVGEVTDLRKTVQPPLKQLQNTAIIYIPLGDNTYALGGSSFAQSLNQLGDKAPKACEAAYFSKVFQVVQDAIENENILAGHDVGSGGLITTLLEMCFPNKNGGMTLNFDAFRNDDLIKILFSESPGIIVQVYEGSPFFETLSKNDIASYHLGRPSGERLLNIQHKEKSITLNIDHYRDAWFKTSYLLDRKQSGEKLAFERFTHYKNNVLEYAFPTHFTGTLKQYNAEKSQREKSGITAAIIREKGVNGDREMAYALYLAGFDVRDVHMTDLIAGRETLEDVHMIVFVGGFSNSDVLGSAKGWAGAFLYNEKAKTALENFYKREDTLSLGVCNGCQLMVELNLLYPDEDTTPR